MSLKLLAFAASLLLAGAAIAQTVAPPSQIEVKDAWARATPGKAENGAAYLTIVSPASDRLTGVSTPIAKQAELHNMTMDGGVMKMRPLADVDLPANQPVTLKPGGVHIMLMGLNRPLKPGDSFALTLSFEKAGKREVTVAVGKPGAMGPEGHSGAGMPMPSGH
jgi:periplasmic copper chaperone A